MTLLSGIKNTAFLWVFLLSACGTQEKPKEQIADIRIEKSGLQEQPIVVGASRVDVYLPMLEGKKVAIVANQTSVIDRQKNTGITTEIATIESTHLVDSLLALNIDIKKVFAPEHGFRGTADAGEHVTDGVDAATGLPIISLYGSNRKPSAEQLKGIDILVFDIQDVGVRFYTYLATLQLVMEACAESAIPIIVLDRPNPNGHYVDGPTMESEHRSFLGMTNVPLVYGMTIGEYALMINEEGWLEGNVKADLKVISLQYYTHDMPYHLGIRPSPNLPNDTSITLYPSLGLFEGTNINAGRGTEYQFQRYGAPFLDSTNYTFTYTPRPNYGSKNPKHNGQLCYGKELSNSPRMKAVSLRWLLDAYRNATDKEKVFNTDGFTKHAGTALLQQQIEGGLSEAEIKKTWQPHLERFKKIREKYLMYE